MSRPCSPIGPIKERTLFNLMQCQGVRRHANRPVLPEERRIKEREQCRILFLRDRMREVEQLRPVPLDDLCGRVNRQQCPLGERTILRHLLSIQVVTQIQQYERTRLRRLQLIRERLA